MITKEKTAQLRFDTSMESLTERLVHSGLPSYARFFHRVGLPNIFTWLNSENAETIQESWLYIPDSHLNSIVASSRNEPEAGNNSNHCSRVLKMDEFTLHPLVKGHDVSAVIVVPNGKEFELTDEIAQSLWSALESVNECSESELTDISCAFVARLFDNRQSYQEFAHRLLTLLTEQVERSYAGLYWIDQDGYHRRWACGDLQLSDKLPILIDHDTGTKWKESHLKGKNFLPAEIVQGEPAFVGVPPSFIFVYETPNYGDREQCLAMAVPGNISSGAINRIRLICELLCSLHDTQLTSYTQLAESFGDLVVDTDRIQSISEALKKSFKLLDDKLRMRSLCLLETDSCVLSCLKVSEDQLHIITRTGVNVPKEVREITETGSPAYFKDVCCLIEGATSVEENEEISRAFFPVPVKGKSPSLICIEYLGEIARAQSFEKLLELTAHYLGICLSLKKETSSSPSALISSGFAADEMAIRRLKTIDNLTGGYFHEFVEYLSIILGQVQILEYELQHSGRMLSTDHLIQSAGRINKAAEGLAEGLCKLRDISIFKGKEADRFISADKFLKVLPALTYGHSLTVRDTKNVELKVQIKTDKIVTMSIPILHVYDFLLPLILNLMDEAICSGKIIISLTEHFGRPALRITYPGKLIGKLSSGRLVDKIFRYHQTKINEDGCLNVQMGEATFIFSDCEGDRRQAIYTLAPQLQPIEEFV